MPTVVAVSAGRKHEFSKPNRACIRLLEGLGVADDAHAGITVQHLSRVAQDPTLPNLRQVHLIHAELHDELRDAGFDVAPGDMGENITTRGIDLLGLPTGALLSIGATAVIEVTGLRNPCRQLDNFQRGLMKATIERDANGEIVRKAGIMGIVITGGDIAAQDPIALELPPEPHRPLVPV